MHLVLVHAGPVETVQLDYLLRKRVNICFVGIRQAANEGKRTEGNGARTPPDFGILTTLIVDPKSRCISTFSFS